MNSKIKFMKSDQDNLNVLRAIYKKPKASQREMAKNLGFSLGKLNYCLKALKNKGLIKIQNFKKQPNRLKYIQYVVTPKGISERTKLTMNFMKRKFKEYDELKRRFHKNLELYNPKFKTTFKIRNKSIINELSLLGDNL